MIFIDFKRTLLRNFGSVFFSLIMPIGFYLLFTKVMNQGILGKYLISFQKNYMVSMTTYSMVISMLFSFSSLLANDNRVGIPVWLRITSKSKSFYYFAKLINILLQNIISIILVCFVAVKINHVLFSLREFIFMLFWLLFASLPIALVGLMISMISDENNREVFSNLLAFPLIIVSGLW